MQAILQATSKQILAKVPIKSDSDAKTNRILTKYYQASNFASNFASKFQSTLAAAPTIDKETFSLTGSLTQFHGKLKYFNKHSGEIPRLDRVLFPAGGIIMVGSIPGGKHYLIGFDSWTRLD